jgi:hypothetical protein
MSRRCEISVAEDEYLQPRELKMIDERMITDFACLDAVYVDDCAIAINLGHTVNLLFYRNMPLFRDGVLGFEQPQPCHWFFLGRRLSAKARS